MVETGGSVKVGKGASMKSTLYYIDSTDLTLHRFLPDTFEFETYFYDSYKGKIIFNGRSIETKEKALFIADENGAVEKITHFPIGMVNVELMEILNDKLLVEITHKEVKDSYDNKEYSGTELWEYDLETKKSKKILDFGGYALVNSPVIFNNIFFAVSGHKDYSLWYYKNEKNNGILRQNLKQRTKLIPFGEHLYFIDKFGLLYKIDSTKRISLVTKDLLDVKGLVKVDSLLIFSATEDDVFREFYKLDLKTDSIEKLEGIKFHCPTGSRKSVYIKRLVSDIFKVVYRDKSSSESLYRLKPTGFERIDEKVMIGDWRNLGLSIIDDELYYLARKKGTKYYNQIWKIRI